MSDHCYYCAEIGSGNQALPPEEAHHAAAVMRVRAGDGVVLFDGRGRTAPAVVRAVNRHSVLVETSAPAEETPRPVPTLVLHVATPKAARQHPLIEKCTELGASAIQPVITEHGVVRPTPAALDKWRRYSIEAAKQSRQWWLPELLAAQSFTESLSAARADALALIASPESAVRTLDDALRQERDLSREIHVWIGPEGGFSPSERATASAAGLVPVSLGPTILRVETAAIAVTALVRLGPLHS